MLLHESLRKYNSQTLETLKFSSIPWVGMLDANLPSLLANRTVISSASLRLIRCASYLLGYAEPNFIFYAFRPRRAPRKRWLAPPLRSSGFISPAFVDPLAVASPRRASWIVDPPSGDSHREENKRATSFVISRRGFYWRCGLNRYFRARLCLSPFPRGHKDIIYISVCNICLSEFLWRVYSYLVRHVCAEPLLQGYETV